MSNVIYLFKCVDSTIVVKGKVNSITVDSCKKTAIVFDSLVSAIEFINCSSIQMQVRCRLIFVCLFVGVFGVYIFRPKVYHINRSRNIRFVL